MRALRYLVVLAAAAAACGPSTGDDGGDGVMSIVVTPPTSHLESVNHAQQSLDFTARAMYADGSEGDVTDQVAWSVPSQFGRFDGPKFTTDGNAGGVATVSATLESVTGTATITIDVRSIRVDPTAPPGAPDLFGNGTIDPARAPTVVYPPESAVVPVNLGAADVHWQDSVNDVFEIALVADHTDVRVYVGATFPRWLQFTPGEWTMAALGQRQVTATVRGVNTAMPGVIGAGPGRTVILTEQPTEGGVYYWAAASATGGARGIFRHDMAAPGQPAEEFYTDNQTAGRCVACHVLSRDGTKMAITYDGGNGAAAIVDVATRTASPSPGDWNFGSYHPAGDVLITSRNGTLTLRDAAGAAISNVAITGFASHPDFSPTGTSVAYTLDAARPMGSADWDVGPGSIIVQAYDAVNRSFGATVTVASGGNNYYPSMSPDGEWVAYNHSDSGGSYNNGNAEIWVVRANGTGTPIKLQLADIGPGLTNSWVRWAPFEQTVGGERMYWLTVSSKRDFGVRLVGVGRPQIWMAAFFPDRAANGQDPSAPAFWLPFQEITTSNHIAQWTEQIIPIE